MQTGGVGNPKTVGMQKKAPGMAVNTDAWRYSLFIEEGKPVK